VLFQQNGMEVRTWGKAHKIGSEHLNQWGSSDLNVRAIYEGDHYWMICYGTIPFSLLLGNNPFLIDKKDARILENGNFGDHDGLVAFFENPDNKNETFDAQLIYVFEHNLYSWRTDDPVIFPRNLNLGQRLINQVKKIFSPKI
jgi:hypothetical protein